MALMALLLQKKKVIRVTPLALAPALPAAEARALAEEPHDRVAQVAQDPQAVARVLLEEQDRVVVRVLVALVVRDPQVVAIVGRRGLVAQMAASATAQIAATGVASLAGASAAWRVWVLPLSGPRPKPRSLLT